jgi:hypothetical protein
MTPSTSYWVNVARFWLGFGRFDQLKFKPGWKPGGVGWWIVYLLDYGIACHVFAIGVQPISRWAGIRLQSPWPWLAALLNRLQANHTGRAGPLLWQTQPCRMHVRYLAMAAWLAIFAYFIA